jgi:predicted ribosome-associated RNA-binding protein Tma20
LSTTEAKPTFHIPLPADAWVRKATTTKEEALRYQCPRCHAGPQDRCTMPDGVQWRKSFHIERHVVAIDNGARIRYINGARVFYEDEVLGMEGVDEF